MRTKQGFSLMELLVSAGAFAVLALLLQNVLLLGHSFQLSQRNLLDSFQISQMIKQKLCVVNSSFRSINVKSSDTYSRIEDINQPQVNPDKPPQDPLPKGSSPDNSEEEPPTLYRSYAKIASDPNNPNEKAFLRLELDREADKQEDQFKDIHQDSHTLVTLNSSAKTLSSTFTGKSADFMSGYVFASRCVPRQASVIKRGQDGQKATFNPDDLKASAKHILGLQYRPYYFPNYEGLKGEEVLCCDKDGVKPGECLSAIQNYAPRIYVIHIARSDKLDLKPPADLTSPAPPAFAGKITGIQEMPELQEMDNMWGAGFMLSMNRRQVFSSSSFKLDIMILKNTCPTSLGYIQNCVPLSFNANPAEQELKSLEGRGLNMLKFIVADVSSCSGYSSTVDTTSAIRF